MTWFWPWKKAKPSLKTQQVPNVLFAGYRSWALEAISDIEYDARRDRGWDQARFRHRIVETQDDLLAAMQHEKFDLIFLIGWSWIVPEHIVKNNLVIGVHPSDLPDYAGGSPLQHQILDGLTETQVSLGIVNAGVDDWDVYFKTPMSLEGNVSDIFSRLMYVTPLLFWSFFNCLEVVDGVWLPSIRKLETRPQTIVRKRLQPKDSIISKRKLSRMTAREIYDFIRCRTSPYPHACVKDVTGTVKFVDVVFEEPDDA